MKFNYLLGFVIFLLLGSPVRSQASKADSLYNMIVSRDKVDKTFWEWIEHSFNMKHARKNGAVVADDLDDDETGNKMTVKATRDSVKKFGLAMNFNSIDIDGLMFLTMMNIARDAQNDIKEMLGDMKAINNEKKRMGKDIERLGASKVVSRMTADSIHKDIVSNAFFMHTLELRYMNDINEGRLPKQDPEQKGAVSKAEIEVMKNKIKTDLNEMNQLELLVADRRKKSAARLNSFNTAINGLLKTVSDNAPTILR